MTQLINNLHEAGEWPNESTEVSDCIKEKAKATQCSKQCTISIMVHTANIVMRILRMMERKIKDVFVED
jgi:hypothetical protein